MPIVLTDSVVKSHGLMMAAMLAGSWRDSPPTFNGSAAELKEIKPLLLRSGAAALVWRRVLQSGLRNDQTAEELHSAYQWNALQAALQQQSIEQVFKALRSVEVEPILVKGWAVARLYPERGLRPCGDIDLCVRPEQFASAETALKNLSDIRYEVDLHSGFKKFGSRSMDAIYARSQLVRVGETNARVLGEEDNLRLLSIHMLREGAWRPLWLCDIAAALESRSADFDWNQCLTENRRLADWVICALRLAQQLVSAEISDTPAAHRMRPLPRWLIPSILKEWESSLPSMTQRHRVPMVGHLSRPAGILKGFRHRWPNTIEATISMRAPFNELPRLPFQIGNCLARTAKFAAQLPKLLREQ